MITEYLRYTVNHSICQWLEHKIHSEFEVKIIQANMDLINTTHLQTLFQSSDGANSLKQ